MIIVLFPPLDFGLTNIERTLTLVFWSLWIRSTFTRVNLVIMSFTKDKWFELSKKVEH